MQHKHSLRQWVRLGSHYGAAGIVPEDHAHRSRATDHLVESLSRLVLHIE